MKVQVLEIRLLNGDRPLRAFADIKLDDSIVIREFRVIRENGKRLRVAPPQLSWKGPDGQIQYKTVVTLLADDQKGAVDLAILTAFTGEVEKLNAAKES
jgi:DNA-binding cell septation regulator SpoVG